MAPSRLIGVRELVRVAVGAVRASPSLLLVGFVGLLISSGSVAVARYPAFKRGSGADSDEDAQQVLSVFGRTVLSSFAAFVLAVTATVAVIAVVTVVVARWRGALADDPRTVSRIVLARMPTLFVWSVLMWLAGFALVGTFALLAVGAALLLGHSRVPTVVLGVLTALAMMRLAPVFALAVPDIVVRSSGAVRALVSTHRLLQGRVRAVLARYGLVHLGAVAVGAVLGALTALAVAESSSTVWDSVLTALGSAVLLTLVTPYLVAGNTILYLELMRDGPVERAGSRSWSR